MLIADVYGGVYRMTSQVYEPKGYRFTYVPAEEFDEGLASHLDDDTPPRLGRDAVEPAAEHRRHPPRRRRRPRGRRARSPSTTPSPRRILQQPLDARRRRRRPLDDEVPRRPLRRDRRRRRDERPGARRAAPLPAEVARRGARPVRRVARPSRDQDARAEDAPALRERSRDRGVPRRPRRRSSACSTPASRHIPATRSRPRQMRDFGGMVSFLVESEEEAVALAARTKLFCARRVARRSREPDRASRRA